MDTARSTTWTASRPTALALLALVVAAAVVVAGLLLARPLTGGSGTSTGGAVTHEQAPDARDRNTLANVLPHEQAPDARDRNADPRSYLSTGSR